MLRWLALCFVAIVLAATQVGATGGALVSPEAGLSGVYSRQVPISDHPHHVLMGHVIIVTRGADTTRALVIHQRRDGVHRLRFSEAWSAGTPLAFRSLARSGRGCTHGHCRDNQVGMILLSGPAFDRARQAGLTARLIGPAGAIAVFAPPGIFAEAAARAADM